MKHYLYRFIWCCITVLCLSCELWAGGPAGRRDSAMLMVVPARYRVIKLALDMNSLRDVAVVSYRGDAETEYPLIHLWTGSNWRSLSMSEFAEGRVFDKTPAIVAVVGMDEMVPSVILRNIGWRCDMIRLKTLDAAELINDLDGLLQFDEREWKYLARRFELDLTDLYAYRQTVNPYSIRRSELPLEALGIDIVTDEQESAIILEDVK